MNYLRTLFLNFLVVFFVNRVTPGIDILDFEDTPNIGADILFSLIMGFLNASVFFFLALLEAKITDLKLALYTFVVSYGGFIIIALVPFGVEVVNPLGLIIGGTIVWLAAFFSNHLEWKYYEKS